jgi:hypothetical protein
MGGADGGEEIRVMALGGRRILKMATYVRNGVVMIALACGLVAAVASFLREAGAGSAPTSEKTASYVSHGKVYFVEPSAQRFWELATGVGVGAIFGMFATAGGWWVLKRAAERRAP